jgi:mannose-6-phosphate isomerase-like protein (cupin superfamily)
MGGYHGDLFEQAHENEDFRRVMATTQHTQLVLMTLRPGEEIGSEVHTGTDQILIGIEGSGRSMLDGVERPFAGGDAVVVPQGVRHNIINAGSEPLRLVTVYGPPDHPPGTVHHSKADAERDEADAPPGT